MERDTQLQSLFPAPVGICTVDSSAELEPLTPHESAAIGPRWSSKRLWDYQAGRHCARRALKQLGLELEDGLQNDARGAPQWPSGVAGSITHTGREGARFAACVVSRHLPALGIDAEWNVPLGDSLSKRVLTSAEQAFVREHFATAEEAGAHALLVFSAKEAFYKCQFPLSGTYLGFHDVETRFEPQSNRFIAWTAQSLGPLQGSHALQGRFVRTGNLVLTAVFQERPL